jgi:signal transduction histidine kinase
VRDELESQVLADLLGLLVHDLRNPLSALQSNVGFLAAPLPRVEGEEREALRDAMVSCESLANLIDSLELVSQTLQGASHRPTEPIRLASVIADAVHRSRSAASSQGVVLRVDESANDRAIRVVSDREMLSRSLLYLLRNGIQYSRGQCSVAVLVRDAGRHCLVVVADEGPRLDPDLQQAAFAAAGQVTAKNQTTGRYGRGLGLYCARIAAERAGAQLLLVDPPAPATNAFALSVPRAD